jgi:hypothetical protein
MRTIRVSFDNGDSLTTDINGSEDEILAYYLGRRFNLGDGSGGDLMAVATRVEFLS